MGATLYHMCAQDFRGTTLYPLRMLRHRFPDLYERERPKYHGRDAVLTFPVPHLGAAWADTVNLSALHPALLLAARRRLGVAPSRLMERRVLCIPVERIAEHQAVIFDSETHWINSLPDEPGVPTEPAAAEFRPFNAEAYEELHAVPQRHLDYLADRRALGKPALGFVFVRHVLVAGSIDVAGLEPEALS